MSRHLSQHDQSKRRKIVRRPASAVFALIAALAALVAYRPLAGRCFTLPSFLGHGHIAGSATAPRKLRLQESVVLRRLSSDSTFEGSPTDEPLEEMGWSEEDDEDGAVEPGWLEEDEAGAIEPADPNIEGEEGYSVDEDAFKEDDPEIPQPIGPVKYFGATEVAGVAIFSSPDGEEEVERFLPGDVIGAEVPPDGNFARLLDGRGWISIKSEDGAACGVAEVHPWAAKIMRRPGVRKNDAASLAYLSMDESKMTPLAEHLPLPTRVIRELERRGVKKASPIQEAVFADIHRGKSMCLQSQTGTGKTLAMTLPLLTAMSEESEWGVNGDKIVVVASCRELAVQLFTDIDSMGFFPKGKGYATMVIVGNVAPTEAILKANVVIGTPNELGGVLHKDNQIITQMNTKLRAIVMDEVDDYMTAPRLFGSKFKLKRKRRKYNEAKMLLSGRLGDQNYGVIEWFLRRSLAYTRRRDLQVLAASATMCRNMARKVFRMLRWDPLGRWYNNPPPLIRPVAAMRADWKAVPRMPTIPIDIKHRYVQVILGNGTDLELGEGHWTRKPYQKGGLRRLKIKVGGGQKRKLGDLGAAYPIRLNLAAAMVDGLHDALQSRKPGSSMIIICRSAGVTVTELVNQLHGLGFPEAEAIVQSLWDRPRDWPSAWAEMYTWDKKDHAAEIAQKYAKLNDRTRSGETDFPMGSYEWQAIDAKKKRGEVTSPILVGFEGTARGMHFDGVETVYILGIPTKPLVYCHMAGRVGRLGQKGGKVISIVPKRTAKVLHSWSKQLGPDVVFEAEPITRNRSYEVPLDDGLHSRREGPSKRELRQLTRERERRMEERRLPAPREDLLLPSPQESDIYRVPGFDGDELMRDLVPVRPRELSTRDRIVEAASYSRQSPDRAVRRIAQKMQRATERWPGPPKVTKHIPRHLINQEKKAARKEEQRKNGAHQSWTR
eukprot:TRINITY_DN13763_c0_g2_i1.p1 TRINITY_DN13763_c0_g2~~TRINITY_DN13763_c0_g2_i1.p1  ORF type:complete len:958 (-),score=146.44 TRINITY_DN13763_c0_g2_i1:320-3154(-)